MRTLRVLAAFLPGFLAAQGQWHDPPFPVPRHFAAGGGTFDPTRGAVLMAGGFADTPEARRDLWAFDGSAWTPLANPLPANRELESFTYDVQRGRIVGIVRQVPRSSPWPEIAEFDGATWTFPWTFPGPFVSEVRPIYDPVRQEVLLLGRYSGITTSTLWSWDGTTTQVRASTPRCSLFGFDEARGVLVAVFHEATGDAVGEWNGTSWTMIPTAIPALETTFSDQLVFDPSVNRLALHGRNTATLVPERWEWNGTTWLSAPNTGMPDRARMMLCGDRARNRLVLFGGASDRLHGDTFEYDGTQWLQVLPDPAGPQMVHVAMSELPAAGGLVVFGGPNLMIPPPRFETWLLQGEAWTPLPVLGGPSPRTDTRMTTDTARQRVILFGGSDPTGSPLADAWAWSVAGWQQLPSGPSARSAPGLCYDRDRDRVVVYGGSRTNEADTWELDGLNWSLRVASFPPHEGPVRLAYDARRRRTVLATEGLGQVQTWLWDGANWTATNPSSRPAQVGPMAYDPHRARTLLVAADSTWEWDGAEWSLAAVDARASSRTAAAYDSARRRIVMYGGRRPQVVASLPIGHTISFGSDPAASFETVGSGCPGAGGEPQLLADGPPWLGDLMTLSVAPVTSGSFVLLLTGFSASTFQGVPLPYSLAPHGFPGCALHAGPELVFAYFPQTDPLEIPLQIPAAPYLVGQLFRQQALAFEAGGTLAASAGREGRFGMR
ncbi:MAG: Kelch repeat-containing protein [Planctomycetota bacterium]